MKCLPFGAVAVGVFATGPTVGAALSDVIHDDAGDTINQVSPDRVMRLHLFSAWRGLAPTTEVIHLKREMMLN